MRESTKSKVIPVEHRDGRLYAGNVPVWVRDHVGRLDEVTQDGLGVCRDHARLHRCVVCKSRYIAHHARRACSDACRKVLAAAATARHRAKRKARGPLKLEFRCEQCGEGSYGLRSTSRYCSAACRQAAFRSRRAAAGSQVHFGTCHESANHGQLAAKPAMALVKPGL